MKLLVATRERRVFDILESSNDVGGSASWEVVVALDTGAIYQAIPDIDLAIVDYHDLVAHPFAVDFVRTLLSRADLLECASSEFLLDSEHYLSGGPGKKRSAYRLPPHKVIALTSYSGGTGKTTLALDTAWYFVSKTRDVLELPAAVFEFTYGASALQALVGEDETTLADLVLQPEVSPYQFHGVSLYPMDYGKIRSLDAGRVTRYLSDQIASNALIVIDTSWPHGMVPALGEEVDLWIVLATPTVDAIENANKLREELSEIYGHSKVILAVNQMGGLGSSLALWGTSRNLQIERVQQDDIFFAGRLGKKVLAHLYGDLWEEYERAGKRRRGLFGLGRRKKRPEKKKKRERRSRSR